jgi:hypothetical protein
MWIIFFFFWYKKEGKAHIKGCGYFFFLGKEDKKEEN